MYMYMYSLNKIIILILYIQYNIFINSFLLIFVIIAGSSNLNQHKTQA
jgi:hypothetical protein